MKNQNIIRHQRRKVRIKAKMLGTKKRPRVSVFRSNKRLYVQLIDDQSQVTLIGMSEPKDKTKKKNKIEQAKEFGKILAKKASTKKIKTVIFDRSGYAYHGRVKALADGMREGGLKF